MKPSYEELESKFHETEAKLAETTRLLRIAIDRIAVLEERLNKNSKNSSKPPSSDQKSNTSGNGRKGRSGRPGVNRTLLPPEQVDQVHNCRLAHCPCCGSKNLIDQEQPWVLQQVELPEDKASVTQYNCSKYACCGCGQISFASLPLGVPNSAFGPRLTALIATLTGVFHLAKRDAMQLVSDLYGVTMSEGSIINVEERVANALDVVYWRIHRHVMTSLMPKHFDETSWRDRGKTYWVWLASVFNATCYRKLYNEKSNLICAIMISHGKNTNQEITAYCVNKTEKAFKKAGLSWPPKKKSKSK